MVQAADIADLVANVHDDYKAGQYQQIMQDITKYVVWNESFKMGEKELLQGGEQINRALANDLGTGARMVGFFEDDVLTAQDHLSRVTAPWRFATDNAMWDVKEILVMGTDKHKILDYILVRRAAAQFRLIKQAEEQAWGVPATLTDNNAWGIPTWVQMMSYTTRAAGANGYTGTTPNGIATVGGITPSATNNWRNYYGYFTGDYNADDGAFAILTEAMEAIDFVSPIPTPGNKDGGNVKGTHKIYCRRVTKSILERAARAGNQQVGYDMRNNVTLFGLPLTRVPRLDVTDIADEAGTNLGRSADPAVDGHPIYIIHTPTLHGYLHSKNGLIRRSEPTSENTGSHDKVAVYYDMMFNFLCIDRRRQAAVRGAISIA